MLASNVYDPDDLPEIAKQARRAILPKPRRAIADGL